jgi:hypothetical protein
VKQKDIHKHPLFWEPQDEFQRVSEWDEPKVFAFGDMDILEENNLKLISENYFRTAHILIERVLSNDIEDFVAQFPIIYLVRHGVELALKEIILLQTGKISERDHSLHKLANATNGIVTWAENRILELHRLDPNAELLRYGGVGSRAPSFIGTDLIFFRNAMRELQQYLFDFMVSEHKKAEK